jgi:type III pantothenate kinase
MLLAFDVGNSNIVLGVFSEGKLIQNWRMDTFGSRSADEYGMVINQLFAYEGLDPKDVDDVIISTVVPSVLYTIQHAAIKYFNRRPLVVGPGIKTGLIVKYDNPGQVGADRIVNAVSALTKYGGPLVIVDLGTATTFCAVTEKWEYLGGSIAPGLKISSDALFEKTSKLPRVELEAPGLTICRNTNESMQSGLVYGHMGMIEYLCERMKKELVDATGSERPVRVIATGGMAPMMARGISCVDKVDRLLTLEGLSIIYEKNKNIGPSRSVPPGEPGEQELVV